MRKTVIMQILLSKKKVNKLCVTSKSGETLQVSLKKILTIKSNHNENLHFIFCLLILGFIKILTEINSLYNFIKQLSDFF